MNAGRQKLIERTCGLLHVCLEPHQQEKDVERILRTCSTDLEMWGIGEDEIIEQDPDAWLCLLLGVERAEHLGGHDGGDRLWHSAPKQEQQPAANFRTPERHSPTTSRSATVRLWLRTSPAWPSR